MKKAEFFALGNRLIRDLPGLAVKGQMLLVKPIEHTLRAIFFDRSIDPRAFYVQVFVQPLFVPRQHIVFDIGWRLGGGCRTWNANISESISELSAALKSEALPFLLKIDSARKVASTAAKLNLDNPNIQEVIAYAWARSGEAMKATQELDRLFSLLDINILWQREMGERAELLKAKLLRNPIEAQNQLDAWEAETLKYLGLEKFR